MTGPLDPPNKTRDAVTTPVGVNTLCPQCGAAMLAFETRCNACGHQRGVATDDEQREQLRRRLQNGIGDAFELLELIGKGGMGVVFRATERSLERDVALKVLAFDPLLVPEAYARFEREAKLAARLDHPNIVPIFAVGQGHGIAFYTMRLVRGGSLEELLAREKKLAPAQAIRYLREIAAALDHAHAHNVVHRDVKPANVMLGDGDHVFVADFGIARAVGGDAGALTSTGVVGSPAYMAPEQWQGQAIDGRADQYALGILAYELLTGNRPYRDATMHELLRLHLTENLPDITQSLPGVARSAYDALLRATAKDPSERYATAGEFVAALDRALVAPPAASRPTPVMTPRVVAAPSQKKSSNGARVAVIVAACAAASAGGFAMWNANQNRTPAAPVVPESIIVHDTITKQSRPDTVVLTTAAKPETVVVAPPANPPANPPAGAALSGGAQTNIAGRSGTAGAGTATGGAPAGAAGMGYIMVAHPLTQAGQVRIDNTTTYVGGRPIVIPVTPGPHVVSFESVLKTIPPRYTPMVRAGDTIRVMFAPAQGGGPQGDSARAQVQERMRRNAQQLQRGGRGRRGDTLSYR